MLARRFNYSRLTCCKNRLKSTVLVWCYSNGIPGWRASVAPFPGLAAPSWIPPLCGRPNREFFVTTVLQNLATDFAALTDETLADSWHSAVRSVLLFFLPPQVLLNSDGNGDRVAEIQVRGRPGGQR